MFPKIRRRVTYANVAMTLALVFAMSGGAYAAKRYLITSTKQISPTVLKQLKGSNGPQGLAGSAGAQGSQGPQGPVGVKGENGAPGANGANGADGVSVASTKLLAKNANCAEGGSEFTATESKKTYACNGKEGKEGSPWTNKGTLPAGSSERGQWAFSGTAPVVVLASLSFPIPLAAPLGENRAHFIGIEEGSKEPKEAPAIKNGECTGTWNEPGAKTGNLCVFINATFIGGPATKLVVTNAEASKPGAGVSGAVIEEIDFGSGSVFYDGSWVVTG